MSDQTPSTRPNNLPAKIGVGVLVVVIFLAVVIYSRSGSETNEVANSNSGAESVMQENANTTTTSPATNTPAANTESPDAGYKDGTYTSTGTYNTPGGREEVAVSVTLKDGKVASSSVTAEANAPTSKQFQEEFINNYKQFVTGKSIDSLKLSKVSGSSLTGTGFNAAIEKIKADAKI